MTLTDWELKAISRIAYCDLENAKADKLPMSLYDALSKEDREKLVRFGISEEKMRAWKVLKTHDDNGPNGTGFWACAIEVFPGHVAVGFRGSEALDSTQDVRQDWVGADLGLLNSTMTDQQAEAREFFRLNKDWLDDYTLTLTGHSLGGNLAEYATIISSEYGLDDNILQCASLDGPGHSLEFINKYRDEIEKMSGVMYHPRWSWVGGLLHDLPGVQYRYIDVENSDRADEDYNFGTRHGLEYVKQDEKNPQNFADGEQDDFAKITEVITEGADLLPAPIGNAVVTIVGSIWIGITWATENLTDKDGNITPTGWLIILGALGVIKIFGLPQTIVAGLAIIVALLAVVAVAIVAELAYELVMKVVDTICDAVAAAYNWAKETWQQLKESAKALIEKAKEWLKTTFNQGYEYATNHPKVEIDTYKMKQYATRITEVNKRIKKLDGRLDSLYWSVGLLDLWNLMQADALTGYSWRLLRCAGYLKDTAADYEAIETQLANGV